MQKITPCLWFDGHAEEAARFYTSIFKNSKITGITHYGGAGSEASGQPRETVMTVSFQLDGQEFPALNGGPQFTFSHAVSFIANCENQEEVNRLWKALSEDGEEELCGWLKDRYGVSWQIVPIVLEELMLGGGPEKSERVMKAMLQMKKINIEALKQAGH